MGKAVVKAGVAAAARAVARVAAAEARESTSKRQRVNDPSLDGTCALWACVLLLDFGVNPC